MIVVQSLMDEAAYPWQALWYRKQVEAQLGGRMDDQYRLWFVEHAMHTGGVAPHPLVRCPPSGETGVPDPCQMSRLSPGRSPNPTRSEGSGEPDGEPTSPGLTRTQAYGRVRHTPSDLHAGGLAWTATNTPGCFGCRSA